MKTNEQWFEAGDKVMRVKRGPSLNPLTDFGIVLNVEWCGIMDASNFVRVFFTGIPSPTGFGWRAENFRKVDEIKLCVSALKKKQKPHPVP